MDFIKQNKEIIKQPTKYFTKTTKEKDFKKAFKFYVYWALIINIFAAIYMLIWMPLDTSTQSSGLTMWLVSITPVLAVILIYVVMMIWAGIGIFITTGIMHLLVRLVKGNGKFKDTFNAYSYSGVPNYIVSPIILIVNVGLAFSLLRASLIGTLITSLLSLLVTIAMAIWLVFVQLKAFSIMHKISKLRAATALYFIPIPIVVIIYIISVL